MIVLALVNGADAWAQAPWPLRGAGETASGISRSAPLPEAALLAAGPQDQRAFQAATSTPNALTSGEHRLTPVNASPLAPEGRTRPWVALETEVHGLVFRVPRMYLHLRFGDGAFEFGLRVRDFAPIALLGLDNQAFWRDAMRVRIRGSSALNGPAHVERSLGFQLHFNNVQTTTPAPLIMDPFGTWQGRLPPEGLRYFPRPDPKPDLPEHVRRMGREQDLFMPEQPALSAVTGEELPEFIMCSLIPPNRSGTPGAPAYPCAWHLVYRNLPLEITLAREHLLRWRQLRAEVMRLLDTFLVGGPEEAVTPPPGWRPSVVNPVRIYDTN